MNPNLHRAQQLVKAKESRERRAAQRLAEAQGALREAQRRLGALLEWQADYALAQRGQRRLSHVGVLKDWRAFQEGLATQRFRAEQELEGLQGACEERRQALMACFRERKTAERYEDQVAKEEQAKARNREQRQADELAGQRAKRMER
jgi:flagellar export protein FliJ